MAERDPWAPIINDNGNLWIYVVNKQVASHDRPAILRFNVQEKRWYCVGREKGSK